MKKEKCYFFQDAVEYLGHVVDKEGLYATLEKLKAIQEAPAPTNISELTSFLGLINYYGRFIANLATVLHPLNRLLKHNVKWEWNKECNSAFEDAKSKLLSAPVLVHYDPRLKLCLATDDGLGSVLSHVMPNGEERPIAFASRTLTPAECNYPQLEKEALSIVFGIKKFVTQYWKTILITAFLSETFPPFWFLFHVRTSIPSKDISKNASKTSED